MLCVCVCVVFRAIFDLNSTVVLILLLTADKVITSVANFLMCSNSYFTGDYLIYIFKHDTV